MRILFVLDNLEIGGVERSIIQICNFLAENGHKITLLCLTRPGPMEKSVSEKVSLEYLGASRIRTAFFRLFSFMFRNDYGAVISAKEYNNVITLAASLAVLVFTRKRVPVVATTHTHLTSELENNESRMFRFTLFLARFFYPYAHRLIGVSEGVAESVKEAIGNRNLEVGVIYNPVIDLDTAERPDGPAPHPWFSEDPPVIVTCGRLTLAKDYAFLLDSFAKLIKIRPARLIIVGDGELRASLEARILQLGLQEVVLLHGFSPHPEMFMRHADLFALTSKWEGFGNVLVEALSVGCPVISTDCPSGPREILKNGLYGRLVPARDALVFAEAMAEELSKTSRPRQYLQLRAKDFAVDKIAGQYLSLFRDLAVRES